MKVWQQVMAAFLLLAGNSVQATDTALGGVPVTVTVTNQPKITVEKPGGGWYDTVTLSNSVGNDVTRYQAQIPIEVNIRNERDFMVSLIQPLLLTHATKPAMTFTTEEVSFGANTTLLKPLSATPVDFSNTLQVGDTSTGSYLLSVTTRQPMGVLGDISGNYQGKLVLLFEVKV